MLAPFRLLSAGQVQTAIAQAAAPTPAAAKAMGAGMG